MNPVFCFSDLELDDVLVAEGDAFEASFYVISTGQTPGCIMRDEEGDLRVVQLLGHLLYSSGIAVATPTDCMQIGVLSKRGGQIVFITVGATPEIFSESLVDFVVTRGDRPIFSTKDTDEAS